MVDRGGVTPDLRYSPMIGNESFFKVVLEGALQDKGMVSWTPVLTRKDAEDVQAYIIRRANETKAQQARKEPWTG